LNDIQHAPPAALAGAIKVGCFAVLASIEV
jgi:hypothetical protein